MNAHPEPQGQQHRARWLYHPYEIGLVGYSGSGKTTLLCKLLAHFSARYRMGYAKHSAHHVDLDRPGKDSARAAEAGAVLRFLRSRDQQALLDSPEAWQDWGQRFLRCDAVLVEGGKGEDLLPKIAMVDDEEAILRSLPASTVLLSGPKPVQHELPWIHRDDVDGLAEFISKYWTLRNQAKAPFALILSGGHSQRMGQDKGRLVYHDCDQVSYLSRLLSSLGLEGALSARAEQYSPDLWPQLPRIYDKFHGFGPMGALLTGLWEYPLRPLLLLPCDRPGLRSEHLASLCEARHWSRGAVIGAADGQLDPCFGIYEPEVAPFLFQALADRQLSLSRLLPQLRVQALPLTLGPNCNSPEERHHYMVKF